MLLKPRELKGEIRSLFDQCVNAILSSHVWRVSYCTSRFVEAQTVNVTVAMYLPCDNISKGVIHVHGKKASHSYCAATNCFPSHKKKKKNEGTTNPPDVWLQKDMKDRFSFFIFVIETDRANIFVSILIKIAKLGHNSSSAVIHRG